MNKRKGFIKLAIRFGRDLVPVFSFGENFVYGQAPNPEGSRLVTSAMYKKYGNMENEHM